MSLESECAFVEGAAGPSPEPGQVARVRCCQRGSQGPHGRGCLWNGKTGQSALPRSREESKGRTWGGTTA